MDQPPDAPVPGGTADPGHPDVESLSALVDGEDDTAAPHVRSCAECAARLASLRGVRAALGHPPPPPSPSVREQAIAAALAAGAASAPGRVTPSPDAAGDGGADAVATGEDAARPHDARRAAVSALPAPRFPRSTPWVLGLSAAALVLVVALAAVLLRTDRRDGPTSVAGRSFTAERGESLEAKAPQADSAAVSLDLGELSSGDELAGRVRPLLARVAPAAEPQAARSGRAAAPPPPVAAPEVEAPGAGAADQALTSGAPGCEAEAYAAVSRAGAAPPAPVLRATATSGGRPVVVVVYPAPPGEPQGAFRALALSREGCRLLLSVPIGAATP